MLHKHGRFRHHLILFGSSARSVTSLAAGLWRGGGNRRWMAPLAVFLSVVGLILTLAVSIEALAPFIYSIF